MPTFDNDLMTRTTGALTKSESSSGVKLHGTGLRGMSAYFAIPSSAGTIKQVSRLAVWTSDDDSTYQLTALWPGAAQSWASGGKEFVVPFVTKRKYAKTEVLIVGTTGTQSFGVAKIGFTLQVGYDWSRAKSFE